MSAGELMPLKEEAAIGFSFQIPLENAQPGVQIRMLAVQTHLPLSSSEKRINEVLDMLHRVSDRQSLVREIEMLQEEQRIRRLQKEAVVKSLNEQLEAAQERWAQANRRENFKEIGKEKADFQNKRNEIARMDQAIEEIDKRIERIRAKHGTSSAADSGEGAGDC